MTELSETEYWAQLADRRMQLSHHTPVCPSCGESQQIQLVYYFQDPNVWRCRICKTSFETPSPCTT